MQQLADGVYVETEYQGVNVGAILTNQGLICIDTPSYPRDARHWLAQLHRLTHLPIRYLILTDCHGDRILNTRWFNAPIIMHQIAADKLRTYDRRYPQALLESLIERNQLYGRDLSSHPVHRPAVGFTHTLEIRLGEQYLQLQHAPGPTLGGLWVYLPDAHILFAGDSVVVDGHPHLATADCQQWIDTLQKLDASTLKIDHLVPGRGQIGSKQISSPVLNYVKQVQTCTADWVENGEPNGGVSVYVNQLLTLFPIADGAAEWTKRQIRLGLDHVYADLKVLP